MGESLTRDEHANSTETEVQTTLPQCTDKVNASFKYSTSFILNDSDIHSQYDLR